MESVPAVPGLAEPMTGDLILACAIEVKVEVLVFGDRWHLLPVREHGSVRIRLSSAAAQLRGE